MRRKAPALVIAFSTTAQAMAAEQLCTQRQLPGRLIPTPREITAGCGLAWKTDPAHTDALLSSLARAGVGWQDVRVLELWV